MNSTVLAEQQGTGAREMFDADVYYEHFDGMGWHVIATTAA